MRIAEAIVSRMLDEAGPLVRQPVRIRRKDGSVIQGEFTGYWDMRPYGRGWMTSVGYPSGDGGFSHGMLHPGDEILDPVMSPEEFEQKQKEAEAATPAKATFWASSGSGAY